MTELQHDTSDVPTSSIAKILTEMAALHTQIAAGYRRLAAQSDLRILNVRRDMLLGDDSVMSECTSLVAALTVDVAELRQSLTSMRNSDPLRAQVAAIEDDLTHLKLMIASPEADEAGGGG